MLLHSADSKNYDNEIINLSNHLRNIISKDTIFVCIGSDRLIADSIGPLVGYKLKKSNPDLHIYGDLCFPITALNVKSEIKKIKAIHKDNQIFAIDASLTPNDNVGFVELYNDSVKPGHGLNKKLGSIGDYKLVGLIDSIDEPDLFHRNIRLYDSNLLADLISESIIKALEEN